jgi:predicted nuclease of predicted toxin-antitoxin system
VIRLAVDENFNGIIVNGVRRRNPDLGLVRIQDVDLRGADDPTILEWAAREGRVLLPHDIETMTRYAYDRVRRGEPMPGVMEVRDHLSIRSVIEDILVLAECSIEGEWEGRVDFFPL